MSFCCKDDIGAAQLATDLPMALHICVTVTTDLRASRYEFHDFLTSILNSGRCDGCMLVECNTGS